MKKLDYEKIMDIQESATKKLLNYIDEFFQKEDNIKAIQFYYPDFDEIRTSTAFNVWISLDYITKYGKNFIEHFLEDCPEKLNDNEKEILMERNKSHISLFEIKNIKGDLIYIKNLLCNKHHIIWEPELSKIVNKSELIFGRVSKVIIYEKFIGDISFFPNSSKDMFLEKILLDYEYINDGRNNISMKNYLRKYSLNVYKIYTDCIHDALGFDDENNIQLSKELKEFKFLLEKNLSQATVNKHIKNLIAIYEYSLYDNDYTLYDLDKINLDRLLKEGIFDDFIPSQNKLNSYIATLKKYIKFLRNEIDENQYREIHENILKISKNRLNYFEPKKPIDLPLYWNKSLDIPVRDNLNKKSVQFLNSYEKYLFYIRNNKVEISNTDNSIKNKNLLDLNNLINQNNFSLINFFHSFSLFHNISTIKEGIIETSKKENEYINLKKHEKLSLFIDYTWNILDWKMFIDLSYKNIEQNYRFDIIENLSNLIPDMVYDYDEIKYNEIDTPIFDKEIIYLFDNMGLLTFKKTSYFKDNSTSTINITNLGKVIFDILKKDKNKNIEDMGKVINLKRIR